MPSGMIGMPNFYGGNRLDRVGLQRSDRTWIESRLGDPQSRIVPVWRDRNLVRADGEPPVPVLLPAAPVWWRVIAGTAAVDPAEDELALLGMLDGVAHFALDLSALAAVAVDDLVATAGAGPARFVDLRSVGPRMEREAGGLCAYARGLLWWHRRHRFCGVCGRPTRSEVAGHQRRCTDPACDSVHFPRTDPAVIMLVTDGDRCLLGRQSRFPPGMYSTLAGFVEPGESLEDAVVREVREEAGIEVDQVRYHSAQPWPFPSSLMLGFYAQAATTAIRIDSAELEDARWFSRSQIRHQAASGELVLSRTDSIARRLVEEWLAAD